MRSGKIIAPIIILLFTSHLSFSQTEVLKSVVNNLAFYNQKRDLKYLSSAKKSIDSLVTTRADSMDVEKGVYRAVVYSSILYTDSLNKLNYPQTFLAQTTSLTDNLLNRKKIFRYGSEMSYVKRCLANVYIRKGFDYMQNLNYTNAIKEFQKAQSYAPAFRQINAYLAFASSKLSDWRSAVKYYDNLLQTDSSKVEYIEAQANIYKSVGDTSKALEVLQKGRKLFPSDRILLQDEANIYSNKKDYAALAPLLPTLLDNNPTNADVVFVAANCYDHLNKYDTAESLYLRSIELNNTVYDPIYNLGILYFKKSIIKTDGKAENASRAAQWLSKANEISPNDVKCLKLLQLIYSQTGDKDQLEKTNDKLNQLTNQ